MPGFGTEGFDRDQGRQSVAVSNGVKPISGSEFLAMVPPTRSSPPPLLAATADAQNWMARVRAIDIEPNVSSSINGLDVDNAWVPELDFTYFYSKNLAAELVLGTARHEFN